MLAGMVNIARSVSRQSVVFLVLLMLLAAVAIASGGPRRAARELQPAVSPARGFDRVVDDNAADLLGEGRRVFRFETFGDEAFWGGTLGLHEALRTVTPLQALTPGGKHQGFGLESRCR